MELKEAIELLIEFKKTGYHTLMIKHNWDRIKTNKKIEYAIDTVLEELNNRIPRKDIEDKIEGLENIKLCGGAVNKAICEEKIQLLKNILKWRN